MGVDVLLYVEISETEALPLLEEANQRFDELCNLGDVPEKPSLSYRKAYTVPYPFEYDSWPSSIVVNTLCRYWDGGAARTYVWPAIYKRILALQEIFPKHKIYYGGDVMNWAEELTVSRLNELQYNYETCREADSFKGYRLP